MVKTGEYELTDADRANGWTEETLAEHIKQTQAAEHHALMNRLFPERPPIRVESCVSFDPHKWGGYDPHQY